MLHAADLDVLGVGIPASLKVWAGVNGSYDFWARVESFLRELRALLPEDRRYIGVADGDFEGLWCQRCVGSWGGYMKTFRCRWRGVRNGGW